MQGTLNESQWRKFSLRLAARLIVAIGGGWAISTVSTSKPAPTSAQATAGPVISPMELMLSDGRQLPVSGFGEPF